MATGMQGKRNGCRRMAPVVLLSSCLLAVCAGAAKFNIVDYGAHVGDRLQTKAIQAAIDACHAAGGGEVVVPEGVFRTGGIELKTGVALRLMDGAILEGSRDPEDYRYPAEPRRWMRSIVRADGARDIAVIGGRFSAIDGRNCYDPQGEEAYRGPHAIRFTGCTNVVLKGYSVRDSANWAHAIFQCAKVDVRNVRVYGGHDGLDVHCCSDVRVEGSEFHTGDDCIAGFGNCGVTVSNCVFDCSCNAVRFGGTDCLFVGCRMTHPATFGHRWGLSAEEKRLAVTHGEAVRHGGQMFSYYCDRRWGDDLPRPGNIVFRDCVFDRPSSLFTMSFDGRSQWCCNKPLASIAFERCEVLGVGRVASIYGGAEDPLDFVMRDCRVTPAKGREGEPPISAYNFKRILLENVKFEGYSGRPCVVKRSEGEVLVRGGTEVDVAFRPDPRDEVYTFEKALELVEKMAADDAAFAEWTKANSARDDAWGDLAAVWSGARTADEMRAVGKSMRNRYGYFYRNGRVATLVSGGEWSDLPAGMFVYALSKYEPFVARVAATDYIRAGEHSPASVAGMRAALRRCAGAAEVMCRESVVEFHGGRDVFQLPWGQKAAFRCTNGVFQAEGRQSALHVAYAAFPGAKPFRGPRVVRLVSEGSVGGSATLYLKNRDSGKEEKRTAKWSGTTEFDFNLQSDGWWQFERLSFVFGKTADFKVALRSLEAEVALPPAAALRLDVETGSPLHITTDPSAPVFTIANCGDRELSFEAALKAWNYFGEEVAKPVKGTLPAGGVMRVPAGVDGAARTHGIWRATAVVSCEGGVATNETRFAVLNPNPVTPRLPRGKFRMGINYHMARYSPYDRRLTLDALNACGAKLVRAGGFSAGYCWAKPGAVDFSRADALMALLKERGLSLNCGCWPNPDWMVDPAEVKKGYPHWIRVRTKPGLMGEYAEKLAAHFGNDIDYIETSNEADLWPTNTMSVAEYVEYQKEVYEGVKRGCRDIRVLTSAWAAADSSNPMCRRKGYQEQVMEGAKGYYDVHPTHQHSGFGAYENDNLTKFFPMRERLGINVPWYANETALTGVNGAEDGVARNVWMKILWSWAHGSTDYIWYNLRATGWKPADPEQWYGLVTADYYPRAGFAAFSALAHVLSGLDFARIVHEGKGRHLFLFKGERGGVALQVLAGWDGFTDPPHPIPVKTDASRAFSVDLMGNIRPAEKRDGGFVFGISKMPGALVMEGASFAEPDAAAAATIPVPKIKARAVKAKVEGRRPEWHLFKWWHVRELYAGNPATVDRTWKGPEDLSAAIWLGREKDALRVKFEVRDDRHVQREPAETLYLNDGLQFILESPEQSGNFEIGLAMGEDGRPLVHTWIAPTGFDAAAVARAIRLETSRKGDRTVYDARIPLAAIGFGEKTLANGFRFNAIVYDDDGLGESRDCWIEIVPGIAGKKEYSDAPFVKVVP